MISFSTYFSISFFLVFLPITIISYLVFPQKIRRLILLLSSYIFFWIISGKLILYLLFSTLSIHHIGLWLSILQEENDRLIKGLPKEERKQINATYQSKMRRVLIFAVCIHLGILLTLKYCAFFTVTLNELINFIGFNISFNAPTFMLPIGISFYTLQAISYLFDVYRRKIQADRNLLRLAIFISFFPQIMEGPICRYDQTSEKLWEAPRITYNNLILGLQRMTYGLMKKLVVADRLNLFIQNIFDNYAQYDGFVIAVSAICYTFQLYMDFSGTMDVVIGCAQIFGIDLPENFKRPFFSITISDFWKRWHITLGTWFKDYIFFPMSMSKPLKKLTSRARKHLGNHFGPLVAGSIALFTVWFCNGLWHGAGGQYIFFGLYHFCLILTGSIIEPYVIKAAQKLHISRSCFAYRCFQIVRTAILVCIGELFFRANGLKAGLTMAKSIFTNFTFDTVKNGTFFHIGMDRHDFLIILVVAIIIFIIGILQEKGYSIREMLNRRNIVIRYAFYYALILFIIIFGAYGRGYVPVDPIYAGF